MAAMKDLGVGIREHGRHSAYTIDDMRALGGPWPCRVEGCGSILLRSPGACTDHPKGDAARMVDDPELVTVSYVNPARVRLTLVADMMETVNGETDDVTLWPSREDALDYMRGLYGPDIPDIVQWLEDQGQEVIIEDVDA